MSRVIEVINCTRAPESSIIEKNLQEWVLPRIPIKSWPLAHQIPVYLVEPTCMDELCPLDSWLDPERVKLQLAKVDGPDIAVEDEGWFDDDSWHWRLLYQEERANQVASWVVIEALGCYIPRPSFIHSQSTQMKCSCQTAFSSASPFIALCPERIWNVAQKTGIGEELATSYVYLHELGHALLDEGESPPYKWAKVVEEASATYLAVHFFEGEERREVAKFIEDTPAEYQAYRALNDVLFVPPVPFSLKKFLLPNVCRMDQRKPNAWRTAEALLQQGMIKSKAFDPFENGFLRTPAEYNMECWKRAKTLWSGPRISGADKKAWDVFAWRLLRKAFLGE